MVRCVGTGVVAPPPSARATTAGSIARSSTGRRPLDARMQREARARATLPIVRRRWWALAICVVLAGLIARPAARLWKAERILEHVSQFGTGAPPSAAIDTEEETVAGHLGMFRARLYRSGPAGPRPGVVVVHGVHFRGIDEPRL